MVYWNQQEVLFVAFLILCFVMAFILQLMVMAHTEKRILRLLPLIIMEVPFLYGMIWYAVTKTSDFVFDWTDNIIYLLFAAVAVLIGYGLAWIVYKKGR